MLVKGAPGGFPYMNLLRPSGLYASVNKAIIGSDNGPSPIQHQAII